MLLGVAGFPILHSKSPDLFNRWFGHANIKGSYLRIAAPDAAQALTLAAELKLKGLNITMPLKERIIPFLDTCDNDSRIIGAVNTVVIKNDTLTGYNTDTAGITGPLNIRGIAVAGKNVVVAGAGGAGKAAAYTLTQAHAHVTLINRTDEKADVAAETIGCRSGAWRDRAGLISTADILVSAIPGSRGITGYMLHSGLIILEADYRTPGLVLPALEKKCVFIPGEEWLYYQAVRSWEIITGLPVHEPYVPFSQQSLSKKHIAVIGFMGAGKTTFGRNYAENHNLSFADTDTMIEIMTGKRVAEIFSSDGEQVFRKQEKHALRQILTSEQPQVIACGGGVILDKENRERLKQYATVIWLYADREETLRRLEELPGTRPLLADNPGKQIDRLIEERFALYAECADVVQLSLRR